MYVFVYMDSSLSAPPPFSVYLALRANDQVRRFMKIHLHYLLLVLPLAAFSSLVRIWGEYLTIHSPSALFFFFKWRLARTHLFHS